MDLEKGRNKVRHFFLWPSNIIGFVSSFENATRPTYPAAEGTPRNISPKDTTSDEWDVQETALHCLLLFINTCSAAGEPRDAENVQDPHMIRA
jgi:hypothetical protein